MPYIHVMLILRNLFSRIRIYISKLKNMHYIKLICVIILD
uniref:Uncharacterized protein n=1 Tax=Trichinella spiralis TaxID=6334 RepID=Q9U9S0_TRISP|nr:unknown [Trichinella spiralis]